MDFSSGLTLSLFVAVCACAYSWSATHADYRRAIAREATFPLSFLLVCCLQLSRVMMALSILFAILNVGAWLLIIEGVPAGGRDISLFLNSPSRGPMYILDAVLFWLPIKYLGLQGKTPFNKTPL
jgi:hypothetical protein